MGGLHLTNAQQPALILIIKLKNVEYLNIVLSHLVQNTFTIICVIFPKFRLQLQIVDIQKRLQLIITQNNHNYKYSKTIPMRKLLSTSIFTYSPVRKISKYQPPIHNLFIQNISVTCNDYFTKFILVTPNYSLGEMKKLYIKTNRVLIIKCIHKDDKFTKGATYSGYSLNLKEMRKFVNWDFVKEGNFQVGNEMQGLEIKMVSEKIKQGQGTTKEEVPNNKKQLESLEQILNRKQQQTTQKQQETQTTEFQFILKNKSATTSFQMKANTFQGIQNSLLQVVPHFYGVISQYEIELENLISKIENGELEDQEQAQYNNFRL